MILSKVYEDAEHRLERNEITLGEFERLVDIEVIEPKRGKWKGTVCSECEKDLMDYFYYTEDGGIYELPNLCPNCGADMREVCNE